MLNRSEATAPAVTDNLWAGVTPKAAQRLLVAAIETFAERGYHATTTRDIAARAAMSPAAVYIHYPTKEDLLYQIMMVGHQRALTVIKDAVEGIAIRQSGPRPSFAPSPDGTPRTAQRHKSSPTR